MYGIKAADLLKMDSRKTRSMEKNPKDYGLEQQFCPWCENHRQKAPRHNNCPYRGCPCLKCKPLRDRYALDKEKSLKYKEKIQKKKDEFVMLRLKYGKGRKKEPMKNYEKPKTRSDRQTAKKDDDDSDSEEERNTRASSSRKRKMAASDGSLEETKKSKKDTDNDENNIHSDDNDDVHPELPAPAREQDASPIRRNREYLNEVGDRPGTSWSSAVDTIESEAEEGVEDDDDEEGSGTMSKSENAVREEVDDDAEESSIQAKTKEAELDRELRVAMKARRFDEADELLNRGADFFLAVQFYTYNIAMLKIGIEQILPSAFMKAKDAIQDACRRFRRILSEDSRRLNSSIPLLFANRKCLQWSVLGDEKNAQRYLVIYKITQKNGQLIANVVNGDELERAPRLNEVEMDEVRPGVFQTELKKGDNDMNVVLGDALFDHVVAVQLWRHEQ